MEDRKRQNFVTQMSQLDDELEEFKQSQPLGGASFVSYTTKSEFDYDYTWTQNVAKKSLRVVFTHSEPGKYHIVNLAAFFRLDNSNVMAAPYLANIARVAQIDIIPEQAITDRTEWLLTAHNFNWPTPGTAYDFYLKLFFKGTTPGTFSVTPVWP